MRWKLLLAGLVSFGAAIFFLWPDAGGNIDQPEEENKETAAYTSEESGRDAFSSHKLDETIQKRISGKSYRPNDHVTFEDLRYITIQYYGFDGKVHEGELIVNKKIAKDTVEIFYDLYCNKYPLEEVSLIDQYDADDTRSMEANNTSCFNYRPVAGTDKLSNHAYGLAIDINPRINPCVTGSQTEPPGGKAYAQRNVEECKGKYKEYMIQKGDYIYRLFQKHGFSWGGDWNSPKDYQHFEKPQAIHK